MSGARSPLRFVHTADLHLDSPLRSLATRDASLAHAVRTASRTALTRTVDLCLDEAVDALVIAGDLYDGDQRSMHTAAALTREMRRLHEAGVPVYVVRGNHDARSRITRELALPDNVHGYDGRGGTHLLDDGRAAFHGVSFTKAHAPESLVSKLRAPRPEDAWNVGLLHTSLAGAEGHDVYAPCSVADLEARGYDYWALGHVHVRTVHRDHAPAIVMPGNPQGRDMGEDGPRSVTLVALDEAAGTRLETRTVGPARFERITVDAAGVADWQALVRLCEDALVERREALDEEQLICRVELVGDSPLAWRAARDTDVLEELLRSTAEGLDGTWIDRVRSSLAAPASPGEGAGAGDDTLHRLTDLVDEDLLGSPELAERVRTELAEFLRKMPRGFRDRLGETEAESEAAVAGLLREGSRELLMRLHPDGTGGVDETGDDPSAARG